MPIATEYNEELQLLEPNDFDEADLTPAEGCAALLAWYLILVVVIFIVALALLATLAMQADAVTLSISGDSSGDGMHTLRFLGENISANITQGNNSTWQVNATGGAV